MHRIVVVCLVLSLIGAGSVALRAQPGEAAAQKGSFDEGYYLGQAGTISTLLGDSLTRIVALGERQNILDAGWRAEYTAEPRMWQALYAHYRTIDPPPRFRDAHETFEAALETMDDAATDVIFGVENLDVERINDGTAKIVEANALIEAATDEIERLS